MAQAPPRESNGLAQVALAIGIISFVIFPVIGGALALILGYVSRRQIDESGGVQRNRRTATAAIALGWIHVVLVVTVVALVIASS